MSEDFLEKETSYDDEESTGTVYRDLITICLLAFITMVILLLIIVNPDKKKEEIRMPGYMSFEITWDNDADVDVDFWVKAPNEQPIGYPSKHSLSLDLTRDDLGLINDPMPYNMEHVFARGIYPDDEYILNIHIYNWRTTKPQITVTLYIQIKNEKDVVTDTYKMSIVIFEEQKREEITLVRFEIDKDRKIVRDSMNNQYFALREGEFITLEEK